MRKYRIICLKRSDLAIGVTGRFKKVVYWLPNRCGYTNKHDEAGIYTGADVEDCAGQQGDWLLAPVTSRERWEEE